MSLCDEIKESKGIEIETPFIIFGRNYTGQFISRIYIRSKDIHSIELVDKNGLFDLEKYSEGLYNLSLYRCALINVQACKCPVVNELELLINGTEKCKFDIYTVIPGHVENAATEANTYGKQLVLDFNMLPVVDANERTSCDPDFDPSSVDLNKLKDTFHVLFENEGEKSVAEHSSFETRFCQMFYQSIKIQPRYKIKSTLR